MLRCGHATASNPSLDAVLRATHLRPADPSAIAEHPTR